MNNFSRLFVLLSIILGVASQTLYGVAYGIDNNNCPSDAQLETDITLISQFSHRVRIYACYPCGNICLRILKIAKPLGLEVLVGLQPAPSAEFSWEQGALRDIKNQIGLDGIVGVTVGSESLYRKDLTAAQLADLINTIRSLLRNELSSNIPVGTADVYYELYDQTIVNACDQLFINAFPYWEGVADPSQGATTALQHYDSVVAVANGKPVLFGETGWPTAGPNFQAAAATSENQAVYLAQFDCRAEARGIGYYIYAAYDVNTGETSTPENNFGVYTTQRTRKSSFNYQCGAATTSAAATPAPTTSAAVSPAPTTSAAATPAPTTSAAATPAPTTSAAATPAPTTSAAATPAPTTSAVATPTPTTSAVAPTPTSSAKPATGNNAPSTSNGNATPASTTSANGSVTPNTDSQASSTRNNGAASTINRAQNSAGSVTLSVLLVSSCFLLASLF